MKTETYAICLVKGTFSRRRQFFVSSANLSTFPNGPRNTIRPLVTMSECVLFCTAGEIVDSGWIREHSARRRQSCYCVTRDNKRGLKSLEPTRATGKEVRDNHSVLHFFSSVQFISRWYLCAREGLYALHPVSQEFPQCCLRNSSNIGLIDDGPFSSSHVQNPFSSIFSLL